MKKYIFPFMALFAFISMIVTNSPVKDEDVLVYTSIFNPAEKALSGINLEYLFYDAEGWINDNIFYDMLDVSRDSDEGRLAHFDSKLFSPGEYIVSVTANDGDFRDVNFAYVVIE